MFDGVDRLLPAHALHRRRRRLDPAAVALLDARLHAGGGRLPRERSGRALQRPARAERPDPASLGRPGGDEPLGRPRLLDDRLPARGGPDAHSDVDAKHVLRPFRRPRSDPVGGAVHRSRGAGDGRARAQRHSDAPRPHRGVAAPPLAPGGAVPLRIDLPAVVRHAPRARSAARRFSSTARAPTSCSPGTSTTSRPTSSTSSTAARSPVSSTRPSPSGVGCDVRAGDTRTA